ncbi:hypothetical protein CapIbe_014276 [Capra ibex]
MYSRLLGITGPTLFAADFSSSLGLSCLPRGILKSRRADFKVVFTSLHIPTAVLLMYTATSEIPEQSGMLNVVISSSQKPSVYYSSFKEDFKNAVTLAYIFSGNSENREPKKAF